MNIGSTNLLFVVDNNTANHRSVAILPQGQLAATTYYGKSEGENRKAGPCGWLEAYLENPTR